MVYIFAEGTFRKTYVLCNVRFGEGDEYYFAEKILPVTEHTYFSVNMRYLLIQLCALQYESKLIYG